jgi:anaerobic magnesium-protoporphyrin IX monomethyl ester cyclase
MRVLILNPPTKNLRFSRDGRCQSEENTWLDTFPPTTLASIAGIVRTKYETKLIDCMGSKIQYNKYLNKLKKFNPDYTIINTSTPTISNDMFIAKITKEKTNSKIIVYGEHITACHKKILERFPFIDYAILGEPETPIMNILNGKFKVKGVKTKSFNGGIWQEPNLDTLPFPAYDLLPTYKYPLTGEKWTFMRSGRGCPYNCSYCVMPLMSGRKIRYHSVNYMIKQIKWLVNDLNIGLFMFWDELATFNKNQMIECCKRMINERIKAKWFCTTRVDRFDEELARYMKKAGCKMITFGIESGSQKVLDKNNKGIKIEQTIKAVKAARKYGIKTIGHFIIGLPGSSIKTTKTTINFAKKLKLNFVQFYIATPFPGSKFYKDAIKNKWINTTDWRKIEQGIASISYPSFSSEDIRKWKNKAYRSFYLRPYAVYSLLSSMSIKEMIKLPKYILKFFTWAGK